MKCPHCNGNHPDDFKFCPITGKEIPEEKPQELLACENEDCIDFGKHILPLDSRFCPRCGASLKSDFSTGSIKNVENSGRKSHCDGVGCAIQEMWR